MKDLNPEGKPFPIAPEPNPIEGMRSYLVRLAEANGYISQVTFRHILGIPLDASYRDPDTALRISERTGWPVEVFEGLYCPRVARQSSTDPDQRNFLGHSIKRAFVEQARHKVCPACVAEDGHGRAFWDLVPVNVCIRHGVRLLSACPGCGKSLIWYRRVGLRTCGCGRSWTLDDCQPASLGDLEIAGVLARTAGAERIVGASWTPQSAIGEAFEGTPLGEVLVAIGIIGPWGAGMVAHAKPISKRAVYARSIAFRKIVSMDAAQRDAINAAVFDALGNWPVSFEKFLKGMKGRYPAPQEKSPLEQDFGRLYQGLYACGRPITLALRQFRSKQYGIRLPQDHIKDDVISRRINKLIRINKLAEMLDTVPRGPVERAYRKAVKECEPIAGEMTDEQLREHFIGVAADILEKASQTISAAEASAMMGMEAGHFIAWVEKGIFTFDPRVQTIQSKFAVYRAEIEAYLVALKMVASHGVPQGKAVAVRTAPNICWGALGIKEFMHDVLSGTLPCWTLVEDPRPGDVLVELDAFRKRAWQVNDVVIEQPDGVYMTRGRLAAEYGLSLDEMEKFCLSYARRLRRIQYGVRKGRMSLVNRADFETELKRCGRLKVAP